MSGFLAQRGRFSQEMHILSHKHGNKAHIASTREFVAKKLE